MGEVKEAVQQQIDETQRIKPSWANQGVKHDTGKPRMSLLPQKPLWQVIEVLEFGADKYGVDNWQHVENAKTRYFDAAHRHLAAWWRGEKLDKESGLPHLAHAVCCLLFLMWGDDANQLAKTHAR